MKRSLIPWLLAASLGLGACASPCPQFVQAVDEHIREILPHYKDYIDADSTLDPTTKLTRKKFADNLQRIVNETRDA